MSMRRVTMLAIAIAAGGSLALSGCGSSGLTVGRAAGAAGGHTGSAAATPAGTPSVASAKQVVKAYIAVNNRSNAARSDQLLASYEGGSSLVLDKGGYAQSKAISPKKSTYSPFTYDDQSFYIPRQQGYPHWFLFQGKSTELTSGAKQEKGFTYLLFVQQKAGSPWLEEMEPDTSGTANTTVPTVAVTSGQATQATGASAIPLALPPTEIAQNESTYLNSEGQTTAPLENDLMATDWVFAADKYWSKGGITVSSLFAPTHDNFYTLDTTSHGALVLGDLSGSITETAPAGHTMNSGVHGIAGGNNITQLDLDVTAQFVLYDPPAGQGRPVLLGYMIGYTGGATK